MKTLIAVSIATVYGFCLRMTFGFFDSFMGIMTQSFLILAPIVIGFLTIILIPKQKKINYAGAFFIPWLTSLAILIVTLVCNIEGSICWIMIFPLFAVLAGVGGVIANAIRRNNNDSAKPNTFNVSFVLFTPALVGLVEGERTLSPKECNLTKSIEISASSKDVWKQLTNIDDISENENNFSFSNFMGFPKHLQTTLDTLLVGGKRKAIYENGLYFDETISKLENEKLLVLDIKTDPNKIPPTVMDEHILIGGKHVDILQDIYKLENISDTSCRLTLTSKFYINTPFNWYAGIWAKYLMADILNEEIHLIKYRATHS